VRGLGLVACLFRVRGTRENNSLSENLCINFQTFESLLSFLQLNIYVKIMYDFSA
jgi:hypothetical protein